MRNVLNGATAELSADQHAVLTACDGCRTIDEHAVIVQRKLGLRDTDHATLTRWLGDFASLRLLSSLDELRQRFASEGVSTAAPFAGIAIRTCDRPALLARALASAASLEGRLGSRYHYIVLDDSRDAAHRAQNARTVSDVALDVDYRDLSSNVPLAEALTGAFPGARRSIEWLLAPGNEHEATYGRPINVALLLTAGRRVLLLDDDALVDPRRSPLGGNAFSVTSRPDELFAYADRAEIEHACPAVDIDPFAAHLQWLGAPVDVVWSRLEHDAAGMDVVELGTDDGAHFIADARIAMTQNHALGDPGSALFPFHLLTLPFASRQRLLNSDAKAVAFRERINWRGQPGIRLTPNRPLTLTTLAGLDNTHLLPPALRASRNEDLLLGELTRIIDRGAWSLDLPFSLPHWRNAPKHWLGPAAHFPQEPAHFLIDYLDQTAQRIAGERRQDRLRAVGTLLVDLALASDAALGELLEEHGADTASRVQFAIAVTLDDSSVPSEWKDMLRPWLASPTLSMNPAIIRNRIATAASVRALANHYGDALAAWPALWEWARTNAG